MIVNDSLKTIYLHNPKTGGTSFREMYGQRYSEDEAHKYWKVYGERFNADLGHINYSNLARFIPDYLDFRIITMVRNPYNRFVSAWKEACMHYPVILEMNEKYGGDIEAITDYVSSLNFYDQDLFLRNKQIPWLEPQSLFIRERTIVLRYEVLADWAFLLNVFDIHNENIHIRADYNLSPRSRENIRALYPEDEALFELYEQAD